MARYPMAQLQLTFISIVHQQYEQMQHIACARHRLQALLNEPALARVHPGSAVLLLLYIVGLLRNAKEKTITNSSLILR